MIPTDVGRPRLKVGSTFPWFVVYSLKTSDKVVRYGENNQVEFSEHPTVVQRGNERTINLLVSTPDVA